MISGFDLNGFKAFLLLYDHVADCIARGVQRPWTSDIVIDNYDFRTDRTPGTATLLKNLAELGERRPMHMDKGVFVFDKINEICKRTRRDVKYIEKALLAFNAYNKLNDGRLTTWKLHK